MAASSSSPRPTLAQALVLTIGGLIVSLFAMRTAMALFDGTSQSPPFGSLIVLGAGALMFSVGFMMLLVAITRPLFGVRPQDERAAADARARQAQQ